MKRRPSSLAPAEALTRAHLRELGRSLESLRALAESAPDAVRAALFSQMAVLNFQIAVASRHERPARKTHGVAGQRGGALNFVRYAGESCV